MESTTCDPRQPDNLPEPSRKPYHPPQVTRYGALAELTQQDADPMGQLMGNIIGPLGSGGGGP